MKYTLVFAGLATAHALIGAPAQPALPRTAVRGGNLVAQAPAVALPQDGFDGAVAAGVKKANMPAGKIFKLGVLSGAHIGFGAFLMLTVGGACPALALENPGLQKIILGAFGLPFGLMMTLLSGAELFTGNTALVTMACIEGEAQPGQCVTPPRVPLVLRRESACPLRVCVTPTWQSL